MNKYDFTLVLESTHELTEDIADKLFDSGCDDGSPGTCDGVFSIDFHREAPSLEDAIKSAIGNVNSVGLDVKRVEIEGEELAEGV